MNARLLLDPEPQSVRRARLWVVGELQQLGRDDLADSAELGVSELVTNAILHADPPITVLVRGTRRHPRVEVHDNSHRPPTPNVGMTDDNQLLRTVGRGLAIVALYSATWGADVSADGKIVWFEPALDIDVGSGVGGEVFDLDEVVERRLSEQAATEDRLTVHLVGMPAQVFDAFRSWYAEIRRELRILAFAHGAEYPVAREMTDITLTVEEERRQVRGVEQLDAAIAAGLDRVDLEYQVPLTSPETLARMSDLLDRADEFCREHRLLSTGATAQLKQLWHWYAGEFTRQAIGGAPTPWPGSYVLEEPAAG